jgi:hypothetical protein
MKIRPVGGELFHVDGWTDGKTDMMKLRVALRSFANTPNETPTKCTILYIYYILILSCYIYKFIYIYKL